MLVGGKCLPAVCGVVALFVVFAFAVRFLDCYRLTGVLGVVVCWFCGGDSGGETPG